MTQFNNDQWDYVRYLIKNHKRRYYRWFCNKKRFVMSLYEEQMGHPFDYNNPKTFTEYLNYFKVFFKKDKKDYASLSDKNKVRNYVKNKIGEKYLIPQYFHKRRIKVKDLEDLPNEFVLKTNNGSGTNYIVKDKSKEDLQAICDYMNSLTKIKYEYVWGEFHYKSIKPCIVAEKLLTDKKENIPDDLKCFCFKDDKGKKRKILYFERVIGDERYRINFDEQWNEIDVKSNFKPLNKKITKPKNYKEILTVIDKLSDDFKFVRVDLFVLQDKIYFGELTFVPTAGYMKFEDDTDRKWGKWLGLK